MEAAERAVREVTDLDGIQDLRLAGLEGAIVSFRASDGNEHTAIVEEVKGRTVPASCGADPEPQTVWRARIV